MSDTIDIGIGIVPHFQIRPPQYTICIDNTLLFDSQGLDFGHDLQCHEFKIDLVAGTHRLKIKFLETADYQTGIDIVQLHLNQHQFSEIDIYLKGEFVLDHPRSIDGIITNTITQYKHLGWSGTWSFDFGVPWLIWALRTL